MDSVSRSFSTESREMMAVSKEIAINLGYSHISTLHFFLANCSIDSEYSIRNFAFDDDTEYEDFYDNCRLAKPAPFTAAAIPLTMEAEKALRTAVQVWFRRYHDEEIKSYHILLAAGRNSRSLLSSTLKQPGKLLRQLERYYIEKGVIQEHNVRRGFWEKFLNRS